MENIEAAEFISQLTLAALDIKTVDKSHHLIVPKTSTHHDITGLVEQAADQPHRKRGTVTLHNIDSFVAYCAGQSDRMA